MRTVSEIVFSSELDHRTFVFTIIGWGHWLGLKHARSQCENGLKFPFQILPFLPCPLDYAALILLPPAPMISCPHRPAAQLLAMTHWFTNSSSLWASSVLLLHSVLLYQPVCFSTCAFVCFCFYLMPPDEPTVCFQQCVALHTVGNFPNQKSFFLKKTKNQNTHGPFLVPSLHLSMVTADLIWTKGLESKTASDFYWKTCQTSLGIGTLIGVNI